MKLRILHDTLDNMYPYKIQHKCLWWWLTRVDCSTFEVAHDEAVMRIRGNWTTMCEICKPTKIVLEILTDA